VRVLLIGQAAFAEEVLKGLEQAGDTIAAVVCPPEAGSRPDPVKAAALARDIPVRQFKSLRTAEARQAFEAADADLAVLAYVTQIVPEPLLAIPRRTAICFHPSLLPRYRGGSAINWQLIRGETRTGVTLFWPDAGIDTGPILLQREATIDPDDTAGTLYFKKLFPLGVQAVLDAVALIREGRAPREPQDESRATHDPLCRDEHAGLDWQLPRDEVHNRIRGCDPQPGAHTRWRDALLRLYEPHRLPSTATAAPGTVLEVSAEGVTVAAAGGAVRCRRLRGDGEKAAAAQVCATIGLEPGARLG
jgi:methionyl-tRNA formyltransferase